MQKQLISFAILIGLSTQLQTRPEISAEEDGLLGLYPAAQFKPNDCDASAEKCRTAAQALWYFRNQKIAVPLASAPIAGFSKTSEINALPPLVWVGSSQVLPKATLFGDGSHLTVYKQGDSENKVEKDPAKTNKPYDSESDNNLTMDFAITAKIPTNLSYWNDSTAQFFGNRFVRLRGEVSENLFTARTVWPLDFSLPLVSIENPLKQDESLKSLVQFQNGGAKSAYETRLLWAKSIDAVQLTAGKAVIGFMLNGAQGDDDEARGGHFAVVTGRMEADGSYAKWLVNNYYNLASNSEKGIIAAPTPMDNYLADVNSGQSYYRPSYMLVAVLKTDKIPADFQFATNKSFEHFYANDFVYDHSRDNCAGISLDTLRQLGWDIPTRGKTSQLKAIGAYFYIAITEKSLSKGRTAYDYLNTETTRLLPAVAFDALGDDLMQWTRPLHIDHTPQTAFTKQLSNDIEAIYFVRIPQIPSSRAFGMAPAYSFDQFMQEAPADRTKWKTVPTTPNPLPVELDNQSAQDSRAKDKPSLVPWPVALVLLLLLGAMVFLWRKFKMRKFKTKLNAKKEQYAKSA